MYDEWSTMREINFLSNLGKFANTTAPREELLKKYREAMDSRVKWGRIKKEQIVEYLDHENNNQD